MTTSADEWWAAVSAPYERPLQPVTSVEDFLEAMRRPRPLRGVPARDLPPSSEPRSDSPTVRISPPAAPAQPAEPAAPTPARPADTLTGEALRASSSASAQPPAEPDLAAPTLAGGPSRPIALLVQAVAALQEQVPTDLPGPQALTETGLLLAQVEQLRTVVLTRLADVDVRKLSVLDGAPSTSTWVARQHTSIDRGEVALARRLARTPQVQQALRASSVTIAQARKVAAAVATVRRHVDRPDGLIEGFQGDLVVRTVVVDGVLQLACEALGGLADDDERLAGMRSRLQDIADRPGSQLARFEAAFLELANHVELSSLTPGLGRLLDAVLPVDLEGRAADGHADRGFGMVRKPDGSGWTVTDGDLDLECGELVHTLLTAELAVDADNPGDTADFEALRAGGWQDGDPLPAEQGCVSGPRSLRQRRHDAFRNGLRRYLDAGAAGARDKVAPHLSVTVDVDSLEGAPGALPARGASGTSLPGSLVRRWACDSSLTRFVMSLGRKVLETSHTARTLTGHERRAKQVETGGVCQGAGCARGPGLRLIPHHATPWGRCGTTSLKDTVLFCEQTHHDLHSGGKTILLKDGRWLGPDGWADGPGGRGETASSGSGGQEGDP